MKHYPEMTSIQSGSTFTERIGEPDKFHAALGQIALGFSLLEQKVCSAIHVLLGTSRDNTFILTAQLSFRQRVDLLGSLGLHRLKEATCLSDRQASLEQFNEILALCRRSEELRNTYLHSSYAPDRSKRTKRSATSAKGLRERVEPVDPALLLDVADSISETAWICDDIPLAVGAADETKGVVGDLKYYLNGKLISRSLEQT